MSLTSIQKLLLAGHSIGTPGPLSSAIYIDLPKNFPKRVTVHVTEKDVVLPITTVVGEDILETPIKGF